jgi:hypothetical protein
MKKIILILAIVCVTTISDIQSQAIIDQGDCGANGNNLTWVLTDDSVLTISGSGTMADYSSGNAPWYSHNSSIFTLTIDNSITSIGNFAFSGCFALTSVTIPNSVKSIGGYAFSGCRGLTSITIPNSITSIGANAFSSCLSLISVTIGNSVTSIGSGAFSYCSNLTSIQVDAANSRYSSLDSILYNKAQTILMLCPSRKTGTVVIPNSVRQIEQSAFESCSGLTSVSIPNSVTTIGMSVFSGCSGLTSITIPNSVTRIESSTFYECSGLTSVMIGNSVKNIGSLAFYRCTGLTSITIPNSATNIEFAAFEDCSSLKSITCLASVPPILGEDVFNNVSRSIPVCIPAGSLIAYQSSAWGNQFTNIQECEVDMKDIENNEDIKVYPNPTTDYVEIETIPQQESNLISIYDITGRLIKSQILTDGITHLDLSTSANGIYLLKIDNQIFKIIKK